MSAFSDWASVLSHAKSYTGDGSAKKSSELWSILRVVIVTLESAIGSRNKLSDETAKRIKALEERVDALEPKPKG